ncbi:GlsB/YeaQ/YmgE family stress response membrane protein [Amnibacterium sp.]|uniref:GlsB/YeaQ/YmgE family stress response membrane protein n=1 Tax=Amnibacterium sp. TaxID=1872496 RepID=UPI003F7B7F03
MGTLWFIITLIVVGLIAGFIARAVVPGRQHMGIVATIVLGIIGSFVGGLIGSLFSGGGFTISPSGIILSIIGAIIVLLIYMFVQRRSGRTV